MSSLLDIINIADNLPLQTITPRPIESPDGSERYVPFHVSHADFNAGIPPMGLLRPQVVYELQEAMKERADGFLVFHQESGPTSHSETQDSKPADIICVCFADWAVERGGQEMEKLLQHVVMKWKEEGKFASQLGGWYDEQSQVHASPLSTFFSTSQDVTSAFASKVFTLVRVACQIFGFVTYGSYLTIYETEGEELKIWIGRRSQSMNYPGMLDITVAGGVKAGDTPFDTTVREAEEEASLPASLIRSCARPEGFISIVPISSNEWLRPQMGFVHDLCLPVSTSAEYTKPTPNDDEVESFTLMPVTEVLTALRAGKFKPNCGIVIIDFLIRKGVITADTEAEFSRVQKRLVRDLGIAGPDTPRYRLTAEQ